MFTVELYAKIRRAVMVDGVNRGEAARRFGIHRNTIALPDMWCGGFILIVS